MGNTTTMKHLALALLVSTIFSVTAQGDTGPPDEEKKAVRGFPGPVFLGGDVIRRVTGLLTENADLVIAWSPVQLREAQQIIREEFKEASLILKPKELVELREQTKQLVKDEPGGFGGTTFTRSDELARNVAQQAVANRIDEMKGSEEEDPTA